MEKYFFNHPPGYCIVLERCEQRMNEMYKNEIERLSKMTKKQKEEERLTKQKNSKYTIIKGKIKIKRSKNGK